MSQHAGFEPWLQAHAMVRPACIIYIRDTHVADPLEAWVYSMSQASLHLPLTKWPWSLSFIVPWKNGYSLLALCPARARNPHLRDSGKSKTMG